MTYNVDVFLSINSGFVMYASCECKSSALGRYIHVGGLLVAVNDCMLNFGQNKAYTSRPCEWNVGKKTSNNPTNITVIQYDCRPLSIRCNDIDK